MLAMNVLKKNAKKLVISSRNGNAYGEELVCMIK